MSAFRAGQRVAIGSYAVGYVVSPDNTGHYINPLNGATERVSHPNYRAGYVWVYSLETGYPSHYDIRGIKPLEQVPQ